MTAPARSRILTTIRTNVFAVEVTAGSGPSFAYTVRRKNAREIIHSGRAPTFDAVLETVGEFLGYGEKN